MSDLPVPTADGEQPAERTVPAEPMDRKVDGGWSQAFRHFGQGKLPGVQPPYFGIRAFAIRLHNTKPKDPRVFNMPEDADDLGPLTGDLCGPVQTKYVFTPGVNVAVCMSGGAASPDRHTSPDPGCMCGFYAYLNPDVPDARPPANGFTRSPLAYVQGVVALSGRRFVGTQGLRAERLRIMALGGMPTPGPNIERSKYEDAALIARHAGAIRDRMSEKYPDVPYFDTVEAMLRTFPLTRIADQEWAHTEDDWG